MPIEGTVVIFDENGEVIPFKPTEFTHFSLYPLNPSRFEQKWRHCFSVDETGKFSHKIPEFTGVLFFFTQDEKHAGIVNITPDMPLTGLTIELRPRYTAKGRLVLGTERTPVANKEISLQYSSLCDYGEKFGRFDPVFHFAITPTDSEGYFTISNVIPGVRYHLYSREELGHWVAFGWIEVPFLQPEQYQEPFSLRDVFVPFFPHRVK
jgi:hypothetical protein